jgi:adenylylsulfate reductase subunit B
MWTIKFRNQQLKRFKFPIRTTPEGTAEPAGGFATHEDISNGLLSTEPEASGLSELPKLK